MDLNYIARNLKEPFSASSFTFVLLLSLELIGCLSLVSTVLISIQ